MTSWRLWLAARKTRRAIELVVRSYWPAAKVFKLRGRPVRQPVFCIETATDQQRDRMIQESNLYGRFCDAARDAGFPQDVIPTIHFRVESRETLDRDYGGSWWEAMEMP
jgi:hypothetical protein